MKRAMQQWCRPGSLAITVVLLSACATTAERGPVTGYQMKQPAFSMCTGLRPDIVVTSVQRSDYACPPVAVPALTHLFVVTRNRGGSGKWPWWSPDRTMKVKMTFRMAGGGMFEWTTTAAMPACLQSAGFNVDMQPGIFGDVTLTVVADADDEISETNEANNELEVDLPQGSLTPMQCRNP